MNKKILGAVMGLGLVLSAASCERYVPTFEYEPVNPGQLQAPSVDRKSAEYRQKYKEIERYEETVTLDVAVCQFELEAGVTKIRVYIWVEGQDADCINEIAGGLFDVNLMFSLTKPAPSEND